MAKYKLFRTDPGGNVPPPEGGPSSSDVRDGPPKWIETGEVYDDRDGPVEDYLAQRQAEDGYLYRAEVVA